MKHKDIFQIDVVFSLRDIDYFTNGLKSSFCIVDTWECQDSFEMFCESFAYLCGNCLENYNLNLNR